MFELTIRICCLEETSSTSSTSSTLSKTPTKIDKSSFSRTFSNPITTRATTSTTTTLYNCITSLYVEYQKRVLRNRCKDIIIQLAGLRRLLVSEKEQRESGNSSITIQQIWKNVQYEEKKR